jgi:small GTP-binding protein
MINDGVEAKLQNVTAKRSTKKTNNYEEDDEQNDNAALFKLIIIGDTGVGKSCILTRLTKGECNQEHNVTIGVEFGNYAMVINNDTLIKLQIWDTAGQESFRSITRIFYKGSHAVMAVFDITTRASFESIRDWRKEIENNAEEDILCYLVGNFADLHEDRKVQQHEAIALCKELGFACYLETSAYTG